MRKLTLLFFVMIASYACTMFGAPFALSTAKIVIPASASITEETAASELAGYLLKATGSQIPIFHEGDPLCPLPPTRNIIYVGNTYYLRANYAWTFVGEKWVIQSVNGDMVIAGGSPRGVLYAVYHFLEDFVGVRWWSPWEEYVPSKLSVSETISVAGEPSFQYRCLNTYYYSVTNDGAQRLWAPRNRINKELFFNIPYQYGGGIEYGLPSNVHTEGRYYLEMKNLGYFTQHPDWVALIGGVRDINSVDNNKYKLCLSNQGMRTAFLSLLRTKIAASRTLSVPPKIFNVSLNDNYNRCECEACENIARTYATKGDAGLLLDFVNQMADGIKDDYPDVMLETLAYMNSEFAPDKGLIFPRSNVIITVCDTLSNYTTPITSDSYFTQLFHSWALLTSKVKLWDYHTNFNDKAIPMPFESTFQKDLQYFRLYTYFGVMTEYHDPIFEDMRDLRLWVLAKLYEKPYGQNINNLIIDFTDGFYGAAGVYVRQYLSELSDAALQNPSIIHTMSMLESCNYVTPEFLLNCQDIFDQAELAAGASELVLRRLRHARLALDKATYIFFYKIANDAPFTREQIATRIRYTVNEQYNMRTLDSATARANKDRFLQFLDFEVMLENCDNIGKSTWSQLAWHPNAFKNEEVGTLALSTENKVEGTGSIQWTVTKQEVDAKPGLSVIRMNYLYGADIARISALKFYVKCEKSNHPPVFASLYGSNTGNYSNVQVLARGEVTNGWKEIVWNLGAETGRVQTHAYFRLFALPGDFQVNDVLEIYLDSIIAQR